jgi:hypothetical protein
MNFELMAGRQVQAGDSACLGKLGSAARVRNRIQNTKSAIQGLNPPLVASNRRTSRHYTVPLTQAFEIH